MRRLYSYSSHRDKAGMLAWKDQQTGRFISVKTLMKRTGLSLKHIKSFENGKDGRGHKMKFKDREAAEIAAGVCLF